MARQGSRGPLPRASLSAVPLDRGHRDGLAAAARPHRRTTTRSSGRAGLPCYSPQLRPLPPWPLRLRLSAAGGGQTSPNRPAVTYRDAGSDVAAMQVDSDRVTVEQTCDLSSPDRARVGGAIGDRKL